MIDYSKLQEIILKDKNNYEWKNKAFNWRYAEDADFYYICDSYSIYKLYKKLVFLNMEAIFEHEYKNIISIFEADTGAKRIEKTNNIVKFGKESAAVFMSGAGEEIRINEKFLKLFNNVNYEGSGKKNPVYIIDDRGEREALVLPINY